MSSHLTSSLHTHNSYCDGVGSILEVVEAAAAADLEEIGISSHAPLPFDTSWVMSRAQLSEYVRDVHEARERHGDRITVSFGLEVDFVPDRRVIELQNREVFSLDVDYLIGSVHFLGTGYPPRSYEESPEEFRAILRDEYANDIEAMVGDYYHRVREMLRLPAVSIVGHLDRIKRWNGDNAFFRDDEAWYRQAIDQTLRAIASAGKILELNTSGWRNGLSEPYPAPWILSRCGEYGVPVLVTADAHAPDQVAWGFERAEMCLADLGLTPRLSVTAAR